MYRRYIFARTLAPWVSTIATLISLIFLRYILLAEKIAALGFVNIFGQRSGLKEAYFQLC